MVYRYRVTGYVTPEVEPGSNLILEPVEFSYDDITVDQPLVNNKPDDAIAAEVGVRYLQKSGDNRTHSKNIKILKCEPVVEEKS